MQIIQTICTTQTIPTIQTWNRAFLQFLRCLKHPTAQALAPLPPPGSLSASETFQKLLLPLCEGSPLHCQPQISRHTGWISSLKVVVQSFSPQRWWPGFLQKILLYAGSGSFYICHQRPRRTFPSHHTTLYWAPFCPAQKSLKLSQINCPLFSWPRTNSNLKKVALLEVFLLLLDTPWSNRVASSVLLGRVVNFPSRVRAVIWNGVVEWYSLGPDSSTLSR